MKSRAGDDTSQRTEIPTHVGVQQDGVQGEERRVCRKCSEWEPQQHENHYLRQAAQHIVDRMQPHRGQPVELFGTVVHGVKFPECAAVKGAGDKPNTHDFDLLGTRATVLWKDNDPEVSVVCITQFSNGTPKTNKYDHFEFNIKEWYWCATAPRGSADVIKKKFEELFRVPSGT